MDDKYALTVRSDLDLATLSHGYIPGEAINEAILSAPTPDSQKKWLDLGGSKGYFYVRGEYVIEVLNKAYGHKWWHEVEKSWTTPPDEAGHVEVMVSVRLFVPGGPSRGYPGLGSDEFPKSKVDNLANTYLSAETRALKRAARYLGIGLDVNDNPSEGASVQAAQDTIMALVKNLVQQGKVDEVTKVFLAEAEQAINQLTGEVTPHLLTEHQITPVKKGLLAASKSVSLR